jgi:hypothetical protein
MMSGTFDDPTWVTFDSLMTPRVYLAGQALNGFIVSLPHRRPDTVTPEKVVPWTVAASVHFADMLLEELNKPKEEKSDSP